MKLNLDVVPKNLEEAIGLLAEAVQNIDERSAFLDPVGLHMNFGMYLRNNWSLWDKETILVQWFVKNLGIIHADDISSTILEGVAACFRGEEFDPKKHVEFYKEYWESHGIDAATMDKL
jgi:hypothetical protein